MAYNDKFKGLLAAIQEAHDERVECILIAAPETLGDDYAEVIESLNRIAGAGLSLKIVPQNERRRPDYDRN